MVFWRKLEAWIDEKKRTLSELFVAVLLLILLGGMLGYLINPTAVRIDEWLVFLSKAGWGGVSSVISAFATIGLLFVGYLSFKAAKSSADATVDNSLFNMIELHNQILESLHVDFKEFNESRTVPKAQKGRAVFSAVFEYISDSRNDLALDKYRVIQNQHNYILGHYFRNLYQILKFINELNCGDNKKRGYSRIVRAQLSSMELAILLLNCSGDTVDNGEFRALLIKYQMLEHLPFRHGQYDGFYGIRGFTSGTDFIDNKILKQFIFDFSNNNCNGAFGKNLFIKKVKQEQPDLAGK